jgi:hypothetical protein
MEDIFIKIENNFVIIVGSLLETKSWAVKSMNRSLISQEQHDELILKLANLHHKLNIYIKKLKENSTA